MVYIKTLEKGEQTILRKGVFPASELLQFLHQQLLFPRDTEPAFQRSTLSPKQLSLGWPHLGLLQAHPHLLSTSSS